MTGENLTTEQLAFIRELQGLLRFHQQIGLDFYPFVLPEAVARKAGRAAVVPAVGRRKPAAAGQQGQASGLDDLDRAIACCRNCPRGSTGAVALSGEGKAGAALLIVVEQTTAALGQKGQLLGGEDRGLLAKMLAAIKVAPEAVYLAPLVKCGAAAEQPTSREERSACLPLLEQQIACLRPRAILVFGEQAAQTMLRSEQPLFHLRGKAETVQNVPVLATYHPFQLRREPALKQMAWQDLQLLQRVLAGKAGKLT